MKFARRKAESSSACSPPKAKPSMPAKFSPLWLEHARVQSNEEGLQPRLEALRAISVAFILQAALRRREFWRRRAICRWLPGLASRGNSSRELHRGRWKGTRRGGAVPCGSSECRERPAGPAERKGRAARPIRAR